MPDERGIVSKSKLTALATAIKAKAGASGTYTLDDLVDVVDDIETGGVTPTGTKQVSITQNGTTTEDVTNYASAEITVDVPSSGITPSGTIQITENGTVDVTQYASAEVNVSGGSSGLSAPYISASGMFTPTEDVSSITIPLGVAISNPVLIEGHVLNQANYLTEENNNMALGFYKGFTKAIVPTNLAEPIGVFFVLYSNANHRSYYTSGSTISISGSNLTVANSRGVVFKAGVPIRYLVIGYDGTDG